MPRPHSPTDRAGSRRDPTAVRGARVGIPLVLVVFGIIAAGATFLVGWLIGVNVGG